MKLRKRLILLLAVLLGAAVTALAVGFFLFRAEPTWYRPVEIPAEEREAAAQRATNKLALIQNQVARARAAERMARPATNDTTTPATDPSDIAITVTLTDVELNAFFDKWIAWNNWKAAYDPYIADPVLVLDDGRVIIAARVKELDTVASLHVRPSVDERGQLRLDVERVLGGKLPLPESVLGDYRSRLARSIAQRLPRWRAHSALERAGAPNTPLILATMSQLLINVLDERPADPVLFLPLVGQRAVPVKLTHVNIADHAMTLTVEPLDAQDRAELLQRIREGTSTARALTR
jgi:uncharacterized protein YpmS